MDFPLNQNMEKRESVGFPASFATCERKSDVCLGDKIYFKGAVLNTDAREELFRWLRISNGGLNVRPMVTIASNMQISLSSMIYVFENVVYVLFDEKSADIAPQFAIYADDDDGSSMCVVFVPYRKESMGLMLQEDSAKGKTLVLTFPGMKFYDKVPVWIEMSDKYDDFTGDLILDEECFMFEKVELEDWNIQTDKQEVFNDVFIEIMRKHMWRFLRKCLLLFRDGRVAEEIRRKFREDNVRNIVFGIDKSNDKSSVVTYYSNNTYVTVSPYILFNLATNMSMASIQVGALNDVYIVQSEVAFNDLCWQLWTDEEEQEDEFFMIPNMIEGSRSEFMGFAILPKTQQA